MKKRKLSAGRSRADLISTYKFAAPAPEPQEVEQDIDSEVSAAIDAAIALQESDPDQSDPNDAKVLAALKEAKAAQEADAEDETPEVQAHAAAVHPKTNPVDENGNVDPQMKCANADCGHLALSHLNEDAGKNTGACSEMDCSCLAMQVGEQPNTDSGDKGEEGQQPPAKTAAAAPVVEPAEAPSETPDLNLPPETEGGESMGPAFTIPVAIIEGQPTGDGREIAPEAVTWRTPPLPLMGLDTETHDPEGWDLNDPAVMIGRIDSFERQPGEGATQIISAKGFFLPNEDGMHFAELCEAMGRLGVSADVAVESSEITSVDIDETGFPIDMSEILTEGVIMGVTACPFPAFEGAYMVLGDGTDEAEAKPIPQTNEEGPTLPEEPPAAVTAGGQLIHWMTYAECEPCDQGLEVIAAAGAGPACPPSAWFANPSFTEDDGRLEEILGRGGAREGKFACPITVTEDGRVFGHIAPWGVCHIGKPGCVTAPKSGVDYAHFKRGHHLLTAEGEKMRVGTITVDAPHASHQASMGQAMAHYENTATAIADVNVGEDDFGIWVAGAIRPDATEEQIRKLRASSISGDWRAAGGQLELVAALAVPVPGFPLAVVAHGQQEALLAAGADVMNRLKHPVERTPDDALLLKAARPVLERLVREDARERVSALR